MIYLFIDTAQTWKSGICSWDQVLSVGHVWGSARKHGKVRIYTGLFLCYFCFYFLHCLCVKSQVSFASLTPAFLLLSGYFTYAPGTFSSTLDFFLTLCLYENGKAHGPVVSTNGDSSSGCSSAPLCSMPLNKPFPLRKCPCADTWYRDGPFGAPELSFPLSPACHVYSCIGRCNSCNLCHNIGRALVAPVIA